MSNLPTVTAIINSHNAPKVIEYLPRALESVINQQHDYPWEVFLINDGQMSPQLEEAIKPWVQRFEDAGITFVPFACEEPSGYQCVPKNYASQMARGEYIMYLDYDNEWSPDHVAKLMAPMLEGDVWPDVVYGRRTYVKDEGAPSHFTMSDGREIELTVGDSPFVAEDDEQPWVAMMNSALCNFIDTSDFVITKGALYYIFHTTGAMWNERMMRFGDWELMLRARMSSCRFKAIEDIVQTYHWTGDNVCLQGSKEVVEEVVG